MKNNRIKIILSIFILSSLFLIIFFVWPLTKEIKKNSEDLVSAKNNIVDLEAQINETNNFKKVYENYKPNLDKIDQLFINSNYLVDFIEFLENTAFNSNVTSQISLPPASKNSQQFVMFQFISEGTFFDMLNFIKKIESGPYLIEIENLTIQNSTQNSNRDKNISEGYSSRYIEATFTIKAFTKK